MRLADTTPRAMPDQGSLQCLRLHFPQSSPQRLSVCCAELSRLSRFGAFSCEETVGAEKSLWQRTGWCHLLGIRVCHLCQFVPASRCARLSDCSTSAPRHDERSPGAEMKCRVKFQARSHPSSSSALRRGTLRCKMWPFAQAADEAARGLSLLPQTDSKLI